MVTAITEFSPGCYTYGKSKYSQKRIEGINGYANALIDMWGKAFGYRNIIGFKYVKKKNYKAFEGIWKYCFYIKDEKN